MTSSWKFVDGFVLPCFVLVRYEFPHDPNDVFVSFSNTLKDMGKLTLTEQQQGTTNREPSVHIWLWPSDGIWRQISKSTLVQIMACCLAAPSHYLNLCWLISKDVLWHSSDRNLRGNVLYTATHIYIYSETHLKFQPRLPGDNELIIGIPRSHVRAYRKTLDRTVIMV